MSTDDDHPGDRPATGRISVLIADDHPVYREGLARELRSHSGFELVATVGSGRGALTELRRHRPRVAVLDLRLPDLDGMAVLEVATAERLPTCIAVLSAFGDSPTVYEAFARGARAFLLKSASSAQICAALRSVARGECVIPPEFQTGLIGEIHHRRQLNDRPLLSPRELEVLRLAADGMLSAEIATRLNLTLATVKSHLQHVYEKLEVSDRTAAVASAFRRGLLT